MEKAPLVQKVMEIWRHFLGVLALLALGTPKITASKAVLNGFSTLSSQVYQFLDINGVLNLPSPHHHRGS